MSTNQVQVHVGETMEDIGARFIDGWRRMKRGEAVNEKHVIPSRILIDPCRPSEFGGTSAFLDPGWVNVLAT